MKAGVVELIAVDRGFMNGVLVEVGTRIKFETLTASGRERPLPGWACPPEEAQQLLAMKRARSVDTKPQRTALAVSAKARDLAAARDGRHTQ